MLVRFAQDCATTMLCASQRGAAHQPPTTTQLYNMMIRRILSPVCLLLILGAWQSARIGAASAPPDWLSPRPINSCMREGGLVDSCFDSDIHNLDVSVDGEIAIFVSDGNRFVAGDTNRLPDVFLWQAGNVARVSVGENGEEGNHASDYAAISGNGRYLYFRSRAHNWIAGSQPARVNLYLKDLTSGRLALISRDENGVPLNLESIGSNFDQMDVDYSGRYVVFASHHGKFVPGVSDNNFVQDIYLADVDPDGNGDYFDSAPHFYLLSAAGDGSTAGNGASFLPSIKLDGSAVVWLTKATDLAPDTEVNGTAQDVILARLGKRPDGSIDPNTRDLIAINRMGDATAPLTPQGAFLAHIDPWSDQVAFVTADNIPGTGDDHAGHDVYLSIRSDEAENQRQIIWLSHAYASEEPSGLYVAKNPADPAATLPQVGWVAQDAPRTIADLLIQRTGPFIPGWRVINWLDAAMPSNEPVTHGALSADGRFAFWTTAESYGLAVPPDSVNLFRRALVPTQPVALEVRADGGAVAFAPEGILIDGTMHYTPTTVVTLTAQADAGYRFGEWVGVDSSNGMTATVFVYTARVLTATFAPMTPPILANVAVTVEEDAAQVPIPFTISDPDPDENHTITLVQTPTQGIATIIANVPHYQPMADFNGQDAFSVQVTDAYGLQLAQPAQIMVHVTPVNDAPTAASAFGSGVNDGTAIPVHVTVQDPDEGDSYTFEIETEPLSGTITIGPSGDVNGSAQEQSYFEYMPFPGFGGVDHFIFRAIDSGNATITGTATVTVTLAPPVTANELRLPALHGTKQ